MSESLLPLSAGRAILAIPHAPLQLGLCGVGRERCGQGGSWDKLCKGQLRGGYRRCLIREDRMVGIVAEEDCSHTGGSPLREVLVR